jgi:pectin methylesterase-like acyl-CoA thioesterase
MFRTLLISLCLTSTALATTWTVDDDGKADFNTIQAAIDAASNGDEIMVMEGMYYEHDINTLGKSILI